MSWMVVRHLLIQPLGFDIIVALNEADMYMYWV